VTPEWAGSVRAGNRGEARRRAGRALAALALFVLLAVAHTWPLAHAPGSLSRHDNADAILNEWAVAWVAHQLPRAPWRLFDANIFYPERRTLAFSEHLVVPAVLGAPLLWAGVSTTAVHNVLVIAGLALTGWAMYLVMARWTGDRFAALVSGALAAFNAYTLSRLAHLQVMHAEFLPLAVWALDRLLDQPRVRYAGLLALAFVLQGLCSNYLLVFASVALLAAGLVRPDAWWGRTQWRRRVGPLALAAGTAVMALLPFLLPYYWASREQGLVRPLDEVARFSASWRDYLATGGRLHVALWSGRFWVGAPTALFPGLTAAALALVAVARGGALRDRRARMWAAIAAAGIVLSFGPAVPGYTDLYHTFPLLQGIRAPVRFGYLMLVGLAALAGFGLAWLRMRCGGRRGLAAVAGLAVLVAVSLEAFRAPVGYRPALQIPRVYDVLAREPQAVVAEFPLPAPDAVFRNAPYMLYSTRHWRPMINGYSGFLPQSYRAHWAAVGAFPEPAAVEALAAIGVTHVVVHGREWAPRLAATDALEAVVSDGDTGIYRLKLRQGPGGGDGR
jgi:hypothetical protein